MFGKFMGAGIALEALTGLWLLFVGRKRCSDLIGKNTGGPGVFPRFYS